MLNKLVVNFFFTGRERIPFGIKNAINCSNSSETAEKVEE
jgi:hypothetical protein